jgi:hypothetical protein
VAQFVERGGVLLVFSGENVSAELTKSLVAAGLMAGSIQGMAQATDVPLRLDEWDAKHPIFAPFADPQLGDLSRIAFSACTKIEPAADARVLARFRNGQPALVERTSGQGSILWFTSSCDRQWSDWPRSRLYLPLVYQLLGYQTGWTAGGRVRQAILEGSVDLPDETAPGVVDQPTYSLVVNTSPREAETERCTPEEFVNRFGLKLASDTPIVEQPAATRAAIGAELIDSEVWHWVAVALLAALLLEALVANRTAA